MNELIPKEMLMTVTTNVVQDKLTKESDYLNVLIPTANNMISIHTAVAMEIVRKGLGKALNYVAGGGSGVVTGRNCCLIL